MYDKPLKYQILFDYLNRNLLFIKIEIALFLITTVVLSFATNFAFKDPKLAIHGVILLGVFWRVVLFYLHCYKHSQFSQKLEQI